MLRPAILLTCCAASGKVCHPSYLTNNVTCNKHTLFASPHGQYIDFKGVVCSFAHWLIFNMQRENYVCYVWHCFIVVLEKISGIYHWQHDLLVVSSVPHFSFVWERKYTAYLAYISFRRKNKPCEFIACDICVLHCLLNTSGSKFITHDTTC